MTYQTCHGQIGGNCGFVHSVCCSNAGCCIGSGVVCCTDLSGSWCSFGDCPITMKKIYPEPIKNLGKSS